MSGEEKVVFCIYCRFAKRCNHFSLAKKGDEAFSVRGFDNYKKATEKFRTHDTSKSDAHLEAMMKWKCLNHPTVVELLSAAGMKLQATRRAGLLRQLSVLRFLLRQGIALRGHAEGEGNLPQLISAWAGDCDTVKHWLRDDKYMSHDTVNELITLMGQKVFRKVLRKINRQTPAWYTVITDEETDDRWSC